MMPMTQWESDSVFLSLYVASGLVKSGDAQSLLLVGDPGEGKSALLRRFSAQPSVKVVSDMTVDGLRELVDGTDGRQHALRHIVMPEFGRLFSHRPDTVLGVTNLLTALMTRDAGSEMTGPRGTRRYDFTGRQIGLLAAMPSDVFRYHHKILAATGFLSRFTILSVRRTKAERTRVLTNIYHGVTTDLRPFRMTLPTEPVEVSGVDVYGPAVGAWLRQWYPEARERLVLHILSLLPSITLLRGRREVNASDVDVLKLFRDYFKSISMDGSARIKSVRPIPTYAEFLKGVDHAGPDEAESDE